MSPQKIIFGFLKPILFFWGDDGDKGDIGDDGDTLTKIWDY
jgi:hypothetical protein